MSEHDLWRVYGGQPMPRTFRGKRAALRYARRLKRLGIRSSLYSASDGKWQLAEHVEPPAVMKMPT